MAMMAKDGAARKEETTAAALRTTMEKVLAADKGLKEEAAREIRQLTKTSSKNRRYLSNAIEPLVSMLRLESANTNESALLALLNLAVKDERNKNKIVGAGALAPIMGFLQSTNSRLQECATAAILTLTASKVNKPKISEAGAVPILMGILTNGTQQAKIDAVSALHNLSTVAENLRPILAAQPVSPIINLLNKCKKSSKTAERCMALLETLLGFEEGRDALTSEEGGVLTVVEVLEEGSLVAREHAVGMLLTMCQSDRSKYREVILREGVIPGLLELTVQGTPSSQAKARELLQLLRDSPCPRSQLQEDTLKDIVRNIASRIDGDDDERGEKAKKMLDEMVQVSMERSWRLLQQRAGVV